MRAVILGGLFALAFAGSASATDHYSFIGKTQGAGGKVEGGWWFIDLSRAEKPDVATGMTRAWVLSVFRKPEAISKKVVADFRLSRVIFDCRNQNYSFEYSSYGRFGQGSPVSAAADALVYKPAIPSTMMGNASDAVCGKLSPTLIFDMSAYDVAVHVHEKPELFDSVPVVSTNDP